MGMELEEVADEVVITVEVPEPGAKRELSDLPPGLLGALCDAADEQVSDAKAAAAAQHALMGFDSSLRSREFDDDALLVWRGLYLDAFERGDALVMLLARTLGVVVVKLEELEVQHDELRRLVESGVGGPRPAHAGKSSVGRPPHLR